MTLGAACWSRTLDEHRNPDGLSRKSRGLRHQPSCFLAKIAEGGQVCGQVGFLQPATSRTRRFKLQGEFKRFAAEE
jgi:hypothetical protein